MDKVKMVKFQGVDSWNRPVFQYNSSPDGNRRHNEFYGATDVLFDYDATEAEVLARVTEADLTYFGSRFGCEPMGSPAGNIKIERGA